jgi:exoribonuclease R
MLTKKTSMASLSSRLSSLDAKTQTQALVYTLVATILTTSLRISSILSYPTIINTRKQISMHQIWMQLSL